jgi:Mtf2 family
VLLPYRVFLDVTSPSRSQQIARKLKTGAKSLRDEPLDSLHRAFSDATGMRPERPMVPIRLLSRNRLSSAPLLPFLYETKSLCRCPISTAALGLLFGRDRQHVGSVHPRAFTGSRALTTSHNTWYRDLDGSRDDGGAKEIHDTPRRGGSTITDTERATFNRIFQEIMASADASAEHARRDSASMDRATEGGLPGAGPREYEDLIEIIASAVPSVGPVSNLDKSGPDSEVYRRKIEAVARYPAALRAAAARASGLLDIGQSGRRQIGPIPGDDDPDDIMDEARFKEVEQLQRDHRAAEAYRLKELARVESKLRAAKTDFELWTVLEQDVFSLAKRIEGEAKRVKGSPKQLKDGIPEISQDPGRDTPTLAIAGLNYPHTLLLAMRLLKHDFDAPDLCMTLFQQVKALGLASYVLGGSTALYNEVLDVKWRNYHNLAGVVELLTEMQKNGVEFNDETLEVLTAIHRESGQVLAGLRGEGLKLIWQTPTMKEPLSEIRQARLLMRHSMEEGESRTSGT